MYYDLKQHGIEVEGYEAAWMQFLNEVGAVDPLAEAKNPVDRMLAAFLLVNNRYHDKLLIADAETNHGVAIMGGRNVANEYFQVGVRKEKRWRDQDVILRGPIVKDLAAAFDNNYAYFKQIKASRPDLFNTDKVWSLWKRFIGWLGGPAKIPFIRSHQKQVEVQLQAARAKDFDPKFRPVRARFIHSRPRFGQENTVGNFIQILDDAQFEVLEGNAYFIPNQEMIDAVHRAARRGVKIILITNSDKTNDLPPVTILARARYYQLMQVNDELAAQGLYVDDPRVEIYEWHGGSRLGTWHGKFKIVDRVLVKVGSDNGDGRTRLNQETLVNFEDEEYGQHMAKTFYTTDLPRATRITKEQAIEFQNPKDPVAAATLEALKLVEPQF